VFLDIDPETFCLDLNLLDRYLKDNAKKVKAVIPVHLYGRAIDGDQLRSIASHYKIPIVEDVAQACGSSWKGIQCGAIGDLGAFSFFPSKNLGGFGDAGMVTTNNEELAHSVRILTKHGGKDKYNVEYIGYNARLDTIQAAVLLAKLPYLQQFNLNRRKIAERYNAAFANHPLLKAPMTSGEHHVYHQFTVRALNASREALTQQLKDKGISTMVYYPTPLHEMKVFKERSKIPFGCPEATKAAHEVFSLPIEPLLSEEEIGRVISACTALS
jgi:dTDP-4-amino-4,6-dideoxygalactose transaminase